MSSLDIRRFAHHILGAQQTRAIYPEAHPRAATAVRDLYVYLRETLGQDGLLRIARTGDGFVAGGIATPIDSDLLRNLDGLLARLGVERVVIEPGLQRGETRTLVDLLNASEEVLAEVGGPPEFLARAGVRNIQAGRIHVGAGSAVSGAALATSLSEAWDLHRRGVSAARRLREDLTNGVDPEGFAEATALAEAMVHAVGEHSDAFLLLQALHRHDEYSYTHSLNVAMLTVAMAAELGLDEAALRDLTIAALLHDIGKELVPLEVLNKPGKLSEDEWEVMQRHSADGALLLMAIDDIPDLAVVVAYEHQLAYETDSPDHGRWPLHAASQIVCIADVYDALRSNRPYRAALPPEEAMRIMTEEAGKKFDSALFAVFERMVGSYPPGSLVLLDDGCLAISLGRASVRRDRPRVMVVQDPEGRLLEPPLTLDLSLADDPSPVRSIEPEAAGIDPFDYF